MKPIPGWDETPAYTGETMQLPKGLYVCIVKQANIVEAKDGREQLALLFDITEGDQKGFYQKMFDNDKSQNPSGAKWRGVFKQNMEGKGLSWFKGIITSIERSNNFTFQWDRDDNEKTLNGKKFGGIFRRRQYEAENGNRPIVTELWQIRSLAGLSEAEVPEDELLPEGPAAAAPAPMDPAHPLGGGDGFINIPDGIDEELPFM